MLNVNRMRGALGRLMFPDLCTIQEPSNVNVGGVVTSAPWTPVAGLVDLPCRVSPTPRGFEVRASGLTYGVGFWFVTIRGDHPEIKTWMRVAVGGQDYSIESVDRDGQGTLTRVLVRRVEGVQS